MNKTLFIYLILVVSTSALALDEVPACKDITEKEKRLECYDQQSVASEVALTGTVLDERIKEQEENIEKSYSLDAHNATYILPFAYLSDPNESPYESIGPSNPDERELKNLEVKFQISFRVPLNRGFFFRNSDLWFGYTQLSLWQLYNSANSAPFRESNYEPELIWSFLVNKSFGKVKLTHLDFGFNHQSNGRSEPLSRSWNRIYVNNIFAYENWVFSFRPWYRIPENESDDDNPDIEDYMGNFDFRVGFKKEDSQISAMFRSSLDGNDSHSYYELGYSYSINRKFRGYVQFINGYGESLIDYNYRNKRLSVGIMLNDWF